MSNQKEKNDEKDDFVAKNQPRKKTSSSMFEYMEFSKKHPGTVPGSEGQPLTWRGKMKHLLHSKPFHIGVIVLVLIDTVLVITEILVDLKVIEVDEHNPAPEIIHYCSIAILSIFMIEIAMKLIADSHHFWTHKMEIFDAVVVVIAFACDVAVAALDEESTALAAVGFLVLLRLWRIVRIVNGVILTVKNEADDRVRAIKEKLSENEKEMEKLKKEVEKLRRILSENGIHVEESDAGDEETGGGGEAVVDLQQTENVISIDT